MIIGLLLGILFIYLVVMIKYIASAQAIAAKLRCGQEVKYSDPFYGDLTGRVTKIYDDVFIPTVAVDFYYQPNRPIPSFPILPVTMLEIINKDQI